MNSHLTTIALGRAAAAHLTFTNPEFRAEPINGYRAFRQAVADFANPDGLMVPADMENNHEVLLERIHALASEIENDLVAALELAKEGIVNETIECRLDSDMNALDMRGLVEIGAGLTEGHSPDQPDTPEDGDFAPVLRRYHVGVTRIAHSSDKTVSVIATSQEDAEERAIEAAFDLEFSDVASEYEPCVSPKLTDDLEPGEVLTWRDPDGGCEQEVVLKSFVGGIAKCTTESGGELEAMPHELF